MKVDGVVVFSLLVLVQLQPSAAGTSKNDVYPDPEMLQYLDKLYNSAKELQRPLVNGELNLLPEHTDGFANSIRCFTDISATAVTDNSKTLHFNLSNTIEPMVKILAIDLVLKQTPGTSVYRTSLHEITEDETDIDLKLLDSGLYRGDWHTLHVENLVDSMDGGSGRRNYKLLLSISGGEEAEDILRRAKPMLLIYTNDLSQTGEVGSYDAAADLGTTRDRDDSRSRTRTRSRSKESREEYGQSRSRQSHRRQRRDVPSESTTSATPTGTHSQSEPCQKYSTTTSFAQLGWPGPVTYKVLFPGENAARFDFCAGTCLQSSNNDTTDFTNHATLISRTLQSHVCCVPTEYTPVPIKYTGRFSRVLIVATYPIARSCGCR